MKRIELRCDKCNKLLLTYEGDISKCDIEIQCRGCKKINHTKKIAKNQIIK